MRTGVTADRRVRPRRRARPRSDVDTDQIIPAAWLKRVERTGFGAGPVRGLAQRPGVRAEPARRRPGEGPARRGQLRLRVVPRARRLGAAGLRLPGRRRAELRRHLPQQRDRLRPGHRRRSARRRRPGSVAALAASPDSEVVVDVAERTVAVPSAGTEDRSSLPDYARWRLIEGLDDIGLTLRHEDEIAASSKARPD